MESSNISLAMKGILQTGKYSDFTIKCKGHQFKEASEKVVDLPDDDFDTIRRLMSYLYLQDFDQDGSGPSYQELNETEKADYAAGEGAPSEISITETSDTKAPSTVGSDKVPYNNLHVYMAADKFGIDPLKDLARDHLASWLQCNWDKQEFPQVVKCVFQSLPPHESQLPDFVTHLISEEAESLLKQESVLDLLGEFGDLTVAILREVAGNLKGSEGERKRLIALCVEDTFGNNLVCKLNGIPRCRHCQAAFNLQVERETIGFGTVRCRSCRTRH